MNCHNFSFPVWRVLIYRKHVPRLVRRGELAEEPLAQEPTAQEPMSFLSIPTKEFLQDIESVSYFLLTKDVNKSSKIKHGFYYCGSPEDILSLRKRGII